MLVGSLVVALAVGVFVLPSAVSAQNVGIGTTSGNVGISTTSPLPATASPRAVQAVSEARIRQLEQQLAALLRQLAQLQAQLVQIQAQQNVSITPTPITPITITPVTPATSSITIKYPHAGDTLTIGQSYVLGWASPYDTSAGLVRLDLLGWSIGTIDQMIIGTSTLMGYMWQIPSNVPPGQYRLAIYQDRKSVV